MPTGLRRKARAYGGLYSKLGIGTGLAALWIGSASWACAPDVLTIRDDDSTARFSIELAVTPEERGRGLMFRESMPRSAGMLFDFSEERPVAFWMRNTLIPLDMLFIEANGTVAHIHENAIPHDETPIPSTTPVRFVFEINGGLSDLLGLEIGAVIQHPSVPQDIAVFPCK